MSDAIFPALWLIDQRFDDLTPGELHLFASALMWSVVNRTDGVIPDRQLARLPWRPDPDGARGLESGGLWRRQGDLWMIVDFGETQTPVQRLDAADRARQLDRERKAARRAATKGGVA